MPFHVSADLTAGGQPRRVRLLGEDLVVFRSPDGSIGLVDHACPHRGAPLVYGRNEDCGIRCVYHAWKFDRNGVTLEMPAEPPESKFKNNVRLKAYPCVERNGLVWTYMGPEKNNLPPLPNLEWNLVPAEQVHISMRVQESNWLQALEGDIDPAHGQFLHNRIDNQNKFASLLNSRGRPTFDVLRQKFGVSIAAKRDTPQGLTYWRVNQFVFPFYTFTPPSFPQLSGHAWVPMDDETTLSIMFSYHPSEPLPEKVIRIFDEGHNGRETGHASRNGMRQDDIGRPYAGYWTKFTRENDFQFNYESQLTTWYSGLPGLWVQDVACQAGISAIADRTKEMLGVTDSGIVIVRRALLEAIRAHAQSGAVPSVVLEPDLSMIRAVGIKLPPSENWWGDGTNNYMIAELGKGFGYEV
jgi:phenylpropionate dioxygenase-like ring-hydroxylating dioxygenase large terminal subunit